MGDVLKCLEKAIEIHLGIFTALYYILVDYIVVGLRDVCVRHLIKFCKPLELIGRNKVIVFLSSEHFKYCFSLRVQVELIVVAISVRQDELKQALLLRPCV